MPKTNIGLQPAMKRVAQALVDYLLTEGLLSN